MLDPRQQIWPIFVEETREHLQQAGECLLSLEKPVGDRPAGQMKPLLRALHSMKGGAGSLGFSHFERLSHVMEDALAVAQLTGVGQWTPVVRGRAQVVAGNQNWNTQVEGGNEEYLAVRNWVLADGANFTTRDVLAADKVSRTFPTGRRLTASGWRVSASTG